MPPRATSTTRRTGDTRAATSQLRAADQAARVGKDNRAQVAAAGQLTAPLVIKGKNGEKALSKDFRLAEDVGIMPLMEWAASSDRDVASADGLRAVFYVLQDAVHEDNWAEFRQWSRENKAAAGDLLDFANAALEALAGRPTEDATG